MVNFIFFSRVKLVGGGVCANPRISYILVIIHGNPNHSGYATFLYTGSRH